MPSPDTSPIATHHSTIINRRPTLIDAAEAVGTLFGRQDTLFVAVRKNPA